MQKHWSQESWNESTHIKVDFNPRSITRDKKGRFIIIRESTHQARLTVLDVYYLISEIQNTRSKFTELARELEKSTTTMGYADALLSHGEKPDGDLAGSDSVTQLVQADTWRTVCPTTADTPSFQVHIGTVSKTGHTLGHADVSTLSKGITSRRLCSLNTTQLN